MYISIYILENTIAILSLLSNLFLIFLASKISYIGRDIKLIIAIALSEILVTSCFLIDFIYYLVEGIPLIKRELPCQILGYVASSLFYFEVMFNLILAIERYYKIIQKRLHKYFFVPLHINTAFCLLSIVWVSYNWLFKPAPGGLVCMASLYKSVFSAFIYFYFVGGFAVGIIVISIYYYKLASRLEDIEEITNRGIEECSSCYKSMKLESFNKVRLRIYIIIGIYGVLMFFSGFLHVLEGVLALYLTKYNESVILTNQFAQLFGILGLLANPIILLSLHTGITKEFNEFIKRLRS